MNLAQAFAQWQESDTSTDRAMRAESWNNYTDILSKDGELNALQYHYCPAFDQPMPKQTSQYDELSGDRAFILAAMNITLAATFVPFSVSRNKGEKDPSLNWLVTLRYNGRDVITTDYMQGCGHCPAYKDPTIFPGAERKRDQYTTVNRIRQECETGRYSAGRRLPLDPPDVADVLHSLLMDGSAIDSGSFADWCSEYGYDEDSIKVRAMYDACLQIGLRLRAAFGDKTLSELRELMEGM